MIVGAEPDGGGGGGFLAATVAALPIMSIAATSAATWTLRTRELIRLRIGRLPMMPPHVPTFATCAAAQRFQQRPRAPSLNPRLNPWQA